MTTNGRHDMHPSREGFENTWRPGTLVPVQREIPGDLETPVSAYLKLAAHGACFLLESVEGGENLGRYSFIGLAPARTISITGETTVVSPDANGGRSSAGAGPAKPPLEALRDELRAHELVAEGALPPLLGGAVGYFGYDLVRRFERIPPAARPGPPVPDAMFLIVRALVVFDHVRRTLRVLALAGPDGDAAAAYERAAATVRDTLAALAEPVGPRLAAISGPAGPPPAETTGGGAGAAGGIERLATGSSAGSSPAGATANMSRETFESLVVRAQEHIRAGDAFQVVVSQSVSGETRAHPFQVYRALRMLNPSPYMFYLDLGGFQLVGSSPESLVKLEDGVASVRPIAGTRPRGTTEAECAALERELLADPKERAEHVMLVDLARNDLGRVCRYGSVRVEELLRTERYSHVTHIVSRVTGRLRPECDMFDLFRAAFPAGTVSGAPKVRAMQLIAELEPEARGPYAGAVGYFGYGDALDTCIAIRTVLMQNGRYRLQAGAGIVADSVPAREWEESMNKMAALRRALEQAEEGW